MPGSVRDWPTRAACHTLDSWQCTTPQALSLLEDSAAPAACLTLAATAALLVAFCKSIHFRLEPPQMMWTWASIRPCGAPLLAA